MQQSKLSEARFTKEGYPNEVATNSPNSQAEYGIVSTNSFSDHAVLQQFFVGHSAMAK